MTKPHKLQKIITCGVTITAIICVIIGSLGLFFSGLTAANINSASTSDCFNLTQSDCLAKCGCGWCDFHEVNSTISNCFSVDKQSCDVMDKNQPDYCDERYDKAIIATIVFGVFTGCCILVIFITICVEGCLLYCKSGRKLTKRKIEFTDEL